uniref:Uncharacterized protein n=1 Tax=Arundo donax TaxID=35708 RepID=A0A0A9ANY3_ARUDO
MLKKRIKTLVSENCELFGRDILGDLQIFCISSTMGFFSCILRTLPRNIFFPERRGSVSYPPSITCNLSLWWP